ncbi:hypothetical protein CPB86DRAFT_812029 [Serendipita vermifera]|nr:hypothetical protein CPB86DRAFT_812029 [Serendipita vermifera]
MANLQNLSLSSVRPLPTTEEILESRNIIKGIDEEIRKLEIQIQELRRRKAFYASYICPFRRLPDEILSEIMDLALNNGSFITDITHTCSRLRYVALGTPKFWSTIQLFSFWVSLGYGSTSPFIKYGEKDALEFILKYAGPLHLTLRCELDTTLLEPIRSRNLPVHSLIFGDASSYWYIPVGLNMTYLNRLCISNLPLEDAKKIMDAAMQSTQKDIEIECQLERHSMEILSHSLMSRVTHLRLHEGLNIPVGSRISLPRLRTLDISKAYDGCYCWFLGAVDLDHIEKLVFTGEIRTMQGLEPKYIPAGLSELSLSDIELGYTTNGPAARSLSRLKRLSLNNVTIRGPLRNHLTFPRLKHLAITSSGYIGRDTCIETALINDEELFRGIPELESLSLTEMDLNSMLLDHLHFCPMLHSIAFDSCSMEDFMPSFINPEVYTTGLPALRELYIYDSWPNSIDKSFQDFTAHLAAIRPSLQIFGDVKK